MENTEEIWKNAIGYDDYQVSNKGNVRSFKRVASRPNKKAIGLFPKVLNLNYDLQYARVEVWANDRKCILNVHRAVAKAFIPNPFNKPQVNHINGIKADNRVENLEWATNAENMAHARATGLISQNGDNSVKAKLTKEQVLKIREMASQGIGPSAISREIGIVNAWTTACIINRKTWKNI